MANRSRRMPHSTTRRRKATSTKFIACYVRCPWRCCLRVGSLQGARRCWGCKGRTPRCRRATSTSSKVWWGVFTTYHKTMKQTGRIKPVWRFLPCSLSQMLILYLWLVRPFAQAIHHQVNQPTSSKVPTTHLFTRHLTLHTGTPPVER